MKGSSTIGYERRHNGLLAEDDEDRFVERTTRSLPPQPPNFGAIVDANRGPLLQDAVDAHPLTPRQLELKQAEGALVVDVRTDLQFDDAHVPGAVCNTAVRAGFGTKLAWVAERGQEIVLVGRDNLDALGAAHLAASVGVTTVAGFLDGGMTSWREEKRATGRIERLDVDALHALLDADAAVQVLDVRDPGEWEAGHIPGSVHCPYHDVRGVPEGVDSGHPVAVICSSGQRSAVAGSLLRRAGVRDVIHVADGGVGTWRQRGWPLEESEAVSA